MIDSVSIDFGLSSMWMSWRAFRRGKRRSQEIELFEFYLEQNLKKLSMELESGLYRPSPYRTFIVTDNKRREISVASIRDRVVHRLLYDYLVPLYDPTFSYDTWSCRVGKGLTRAIERAQGFLKSCKTGYVWRSDMTKFFDSVNHAVLISLLERRVRDERAMGLLEMMVLTYARKPGGGEGSD